MWSMTDDKVKRRLTTVLCADVHGYSRLMGADEAGTLGTLRRYRSAIAGLVKRPDCAGASRCVRITPPQRAVWPVERVEDRE
jgi:class 3 adenylate cyclase